MWNENRILRRPNSGGGAKSKWHSSETTAYFGLLRFFYAENQARIARYRYAILQKATYAERNASMMDTSYKLTAVGLSEK